jgi:16S rRNA (guanine527-N7)-methyltransferase
VQAEHLAEHPMNHEPMTEQLLACLREAQRTGSVGSGALEDHLEQALGYFAPIGSPLDGICVDLGSGGGLPALPLALTHRATSWVLVEAWERRAALLRRFVRLLELNDRVEVIADRAESVGRGSWRGTAHIVTARSFGRAAVALECAAPLLRVGGCVVLSVRDAEPAWPVTALDVLGLADPTEWQAGRFNYRSVQSVEAVADRFPRRPGLPEKSPLF